jgi:hypothetical protein
MPPADGWIEQAEKTIRLPLKKRADMLGADERKRLRLACQSGNILLGEDPGRSPYIDSTLELENLIRQLHGQTEREHE